MRRWIVLAVVGLVAAAGGTVAGLRLAGSPSLPDWLARVRDGAAQTAASDPHAGHAPAATTAAAAREVLYYRAPDGTPDYSPVPKQDAQGRDYLPVYEDEEESLAPSEPAAEAQQDRGRVLYYRNPMGLPDVSPVPKKDQMGMDYIPVYENEVAEGPVVRVDPARVQMLGVRTETVARRDLVRSVQAAGTVAFDERREAVVSTKFEGWIERLLVDATGQPVRRGQPLAEVYSPDLLLAQQEYAAIRASLAAVAPVDGTDRAVGADATERLLTGALQRLRYLDFPEDDLRALQAGASPRRTLTLRSPFAGIVTDKPAVAGMRFMPGETLYEIVDIDRVWLLADVYEQDLAAVAPGQPAEIRVKAYPDRVFGGRVSFVYPTVGAETRTARVRIDVPNPGGALKAGMYATVDIAAPLGRRDTVAVPDSALIDDGRRRVVLIEHAPGRFEPRPVRTGERGGGFVEVLDGVSVGERVVVGANFLIDAESNLRAALQQFGAGANGGGEAGR